MKNCVQNASIIKSDFIFDVWLLRTFKPSLSSFLSDKKARYSFLWKVIPTKKNPPIIFNYQKVPKPVSSCSQAILDLLGISALLSPENHSVNNNHHYLRPLTPPFFFNILLMCAWDLQTWRPNKISMRSILFHLWSLATIGSESGMPRQSSPSLGLSLYLPSSSAPLL